MTVAPTEGRLVFLSTSLFSPGGGTGTPGADALCQADATTASVPGTFLALLARQSGSASTRFVAAGDPWIRPDGVLVGTAIEFLNGDLRAPINVTLRLLRRGSGMDRIPRLCVPRIRHRLPYRLVFRQQRRHGASWVHRRHDILLHFRNQRGDVEQTLPAYLEKHPHTIVSLAHIDVNLYGPTKSCLERIMDHVVKGSIIVIDEVNCEQFPGETVALKEVLGLKNIRLKRHPTINPTWPAYFVVE